MANVATPRPEWTEDEELRALPLALKEGIQALKRDAGVSLLAGNVDRSTAAGGSRNWLWPNPGEEDIVEEGGVLRQTRFERRMKRLRLYNVFADGLGAAAALPWRNPLQATGWSTALDPMISNVDGQGNSLTGFAQVASVQKFFAGIHFGLVDLPEDGTPEPFWLHVPAGSLFHWTWGMSGSRIRLLEAKIMAGHSKAELTEDPNNFDNAEDAQEIFVYRAGDLSLGPDSELGSYRSMKYLKDGKGYKEAWTEWRRPGAAGVLRDIPLAPFYSRWDEPFRSPPSFADAAHSQMEMVRARSELDDMCRRAKEPQMILSGVRPDSDDAGWTDAGDVIFLDSSDARSKMEQIDAEGIKILSEEIDKGETAVRMSCLDPMMAEPTGRVTATEIGLREIRAASWLEASAKSDVASIKMLMGYSQQILGLSSDAGDVKLPSQYLEVVSSQDKLAQLYKELAGMGKLSTRTLWKQLRSLEVGVPEDFDEDGEVRRIAEERAAQGRGTDEP